MLGRVRLPWGKAMRHAARVAGLGVEVETVGMQVLGRCAGGDNRVDSIHGICNHLVAHLGETVMEIAVDPSEVEVEFF